MTDSLEKIQNAEGRIYPKREILGGKVEKFEREETLERLSPFSLYHLFIQQMVIVPSFQVPCHAFGAEDA